MAEAKSHLFKIPTLDEMVKPQITSSEMKLFTRQQKTSSTPSGQERSVSDCNATIEGLPPSISDEKDAAGDSIKGSEVTKSVAISTSTTCSAASKPKSQLSNAIIVSLKQRGNPILKQVRNVAWQFGDIVPDYQMGKTTCALFLSLRYHQLHPNYIHERLKQLGHSFDLRILLTLVDVKDPHHSLKELAKMCLLADCTLMLAFSTEEAGRLLETYKSFENKPPELIMEKAERNRLSQVIDTLTSVKTVNKTDAMTLLSTFRTFENISQTSQEEVSLCPGFGPQKAARLHQIFHEPFLRAKKTKTTAAHTASTTSMSTTTTTIPHRSTAPDLT